MRATAILISVAVVACTASSANAARSDSDTDDGVAWGVIPAFRFGTHSLELTTPDGKVGTASGHRQAVDLTVLGVLPGDRFALGLSGGFYYDTADQDGYQHGDYGIEVGPVAMIGIFSRLFVHGRALRYSGTSDDELDTSGFRFGGGATLVVYRGHMGDVGLQLDVLRSIGKAKLDQTEVDLKATTVSLGFLFSFDATSAF